MSPRMEKRLWGVLIALLFVGCVVGYLALYHAGHTHAPPVMHFRPQPLGGTPSIPGAGG